MLKKVITGDEALAWGALEARVGLVTGSPEVASSQTFEHFKAIGDLRIHWSVNGRVALERALGTSIIGMRSLVCLTSEGLNVALDPLMTINLTGVRGGLVILVGDDPGAWDSQNEQDSRLLGTFAEIPLLEPASPQEGWKMMIEAFRISEEYELLVTIRITPSYSLMEQEAQNPSTELPKGLELGYQREGMRWISFPVNVVENHERLHRRLREIGQLFELSPFNKISGKGPKGIIASGQVYAKLTEVLGDNYEEQFILLKLGTLFPLPETAVIHLLEITEATLILEENMPFIENMVREVAQRRGIKTEIWGRTNERVPQEGELFKWQIEEVLADFEPEFTSPQVFFPYQEQKERPITQGLCTGCPYLSAFGALKQAIDEDYPDHPPVIVGDPGCALQLNFHPYKFLDVSYSLSSAIGIALGIAKGRAKSKVIVIIGDSAFYHGGINSLIEAAHDEANILILLLDNGQGARHELTSKLQIEGLIRACNVNLLGIVSPEDVPRLKQFYKEGLAFEGLGVIIIRYPCPLIS